jgi:hypothetical protein
MTTLNASSLIDRLKSCPTGFDPTADHAHGTVQPQKIAFVPVALADDLIAFLSGKK